MKIKELLNVKGQLNMNPAYQRDYIAGENKPWQRKLIGNLMKGEVKDIKLTNKGSEKRATAQTGTVPIDKLSEMIEKFSGEKDDKDIPIHTKSLNNSSDISTWTTYLKGIMNDSSLKKTMG